MGGYAPGFLIERELKARGWSEHDLASAMGSPLSVVQALIVGSVPLTPAVADRLSMSLGFSPAMWLELEAEYRSAIN